MILTLNRIHIKPEKHGAMVRNVLYCVVFRGAGCGAYIKEQLAGWGQLKPARDMESDEPIDVMTL